jgi:hypothetical protein
LRLEDEAKVVALASREVGGEALIVEDRPFADIRWLGKPYVRDEERVEVFAFLPLAVPALD